MTHRQRMELTLNHKQPDRLVIDLGGCGQTGINASTLYKLRAALKLEQRPIKIIEPFQMLGEIEEDLATLLEVDVCGIFNKGTMMGFDNQDWKPWTMPDGTPVLMGGNFEYDIDNTSGDVLSYVGGDRTYPPAHRMTHAGSFFDSIDRCKEYDEDDLNGKRDYKEDYTVATDEAARYWEEKSKHLFQNTDYSLMGVLGGAGFGDVASVPGPGIKQPTGIRTIEEWLVAHALYPEYIEDVFGYQLEVMLKNLEIYKQAVGDRIQVIWVSGTDLGTQHGTFTSLDQFRKLYKPYFSAVNKWVHSNTKWKTFYHTCGCVTPLLDDLHDMGLDCLNPVQISAMQNKGGMTAEKLKQQYGDKFVFWGGGVDTQSVLPFGTPDEVRAQVKQRIDTFSPNGGFVFSTIHNIVSGVPTENLVAMFETVLNKTLV